MKLSILYVNYNTTELLCDSLQSVRRNLSVSHEVIVVDNASDNFNLEKITRIHPEANIIVSPENLGFGQANNLAATKATGDYLWLLNTDTLIPPDHHIEAILGFLDAHPDYAAAGPLLTNESGDIQPGQIAYFPTLPKLILDKPIGLIAGKLPAVKPLAQKLNADHLAINERDVDMAVAAAFIVRRDLFLKVGGFSKEYFMYYEDMDLCRKLHAQGGRIRFMPQGHIVHIWGGSLSSNRHRKQLYYRSQTIYFKKWHGAIAALVLQVLRVPMTLRYYIKH